MKIARAAIIVLAACGSRPGVEHPTPPLGSTSPFASDAPSNAPGARLLALDKAGAFCPSVAVDHDGTLYQAADVRWPADIGPLHVEPRRGASSVVVLARDPAGSVLWAHDFGEGGRATIADARASTGVAVAWRHGGEVVLTRMSATGATLWERRFSTAGTPGDSELAISSLVLDASGDVLAAGIVDGPATIGQERIGDAGSTTFLARFRAAGDVRILQVAPGKYPPELARGKSDELAFARDEGKDDTRIQGISPDGTVRFGRVWSGVAVPPMLAGAPDGGWIAAGDVHSLDAIVDDRHLYGNVPATDDVLVARIEADGRAGFAHRFTAKLRQRVRALAVDVEGRAWISGTFRGELDMGGAPLDAAIGADGDPPFVAVFAPGGEARYAKRLSEGGDTTMDGFASLAVSPSGVILSVAYRPSLEIGGEGDTRVTGPTACATLLFAGTKE